MATHNVASQTDKERIHLTLKELAAIGFRRWRLIAISFVFIFGFIALALLLQPDVYEAEMKILVKHDRVDPLVTPESGSVARVNPITEQDLRSEAELLKSRDLLERAVVGCGLQKPKETLLTFVPVLNAFAGTTKAQDKSDPVTISEAVRSLNDDVRALPLRNSNLISVTYESKNPTMAACVLNTLAKNYMDKHLSVHRQSGAFGFFKQEAERYKQQLNELEARLTLFGQTEQLVTPGIEKEISIRKLGDYNASLVDTRTNIAGLQARIRSLEAQQASMQPRQTRSVRTAPSRRLTELEGSLVSLEIKRGEMLEKFAPTYRPVQELQKQIQQVRDAVAVAEKEPAVEETTDLDPAHEWVRVELAKAHSELAALQASAPARQSAVQEYRAIVLDLDKKDIQRQDLTRLAKVAEEKYLLYLRKQEEARIDQELDKQRFLNVALAEEATVPLLPRRSQLPVKIGFAGALAAMMSFGIAFGADRFNRSFRAPEDVPNTRGLPVIASLPLINAPLANPPERQREDKK